LFILLKVYNINLLDQPMVMKQRQCMCGRRYAQLKSQKRNG